MCNNKNQKAKSNSCTFSCILFSNITFTKLFVSVSFDFEISQISFYNDKKFIHENKFADTHIQLETYKSFFDLSYTLISRYSIENRVAFTRKASFVL